MNRTRPSFSKPFDDALIRTEMISEMAAAEGWSNLDECLRIAPEAMEIFGCHADAALRVMQRIEEREATLKPSEHDEFCDKTE